MAATDPYFDPNVRAARGAPATAPASVADTAPTTFDYVGRGTTPGATPEPPSVTSIDPSAYGARGAEAPAAEAPAAGTPDQASSGAQAAAIAAGGGAGGTASGYTQGSATLPGGTGGGQAQPGGGPVSQGTGMGALPTTGGTNEEIYHNALLAQMGQNPIPSAEDPAIRAQLDPLRVENQRAMEAENRAGAEADFAHGTGYGAGERAAAAARAGERTGLQAGQLVGQELQARRAQIQDALTKFGATMTEDQRQALQMKMKDIDASLAREEMASKAGLTREQLAQEKELELGRQGIQKQGLEQTGELGRSDIALRGELGRGGLSNELSRILLEDKMAKNRLGADMGYNEARLNNEALLSMMGG